MEYYDSNIIRYTKEIESDEFNAMPLHMQNELMRKTIISMSDDLCRLIKIVLNLQESLKDTTEWMDGELFDHTTRTNEIEEKINNHVNGIHAHLIIGKSEIEET